MVVQCDHLNAGRIATVICVPLTGTLKWAEHIGNVLLPSDCTGLPGDSVANVSQVSAFNKSRLRERVGRLRREDLEAVLDGVGRVLGR